MKIFLMIIESVLALTGLGSIAFMYTVFEENRPLILSIVCSLITAIVSLAALVCLIIKV